MKKANSTNTNPFSCPAEDCGRKFPTQQKLDEHIANRHPELVKKKKNFDELLDHIKSLETFVEKEGNELREHLDIPELPNYDNILSDVSEEESEEKEEPKMMKEPEKKKEEENKPKDDKIIEITDEMLGIGKEYEDYENIKEINLSKMKIASFLTKRNVDFTEITNLRKIDLSFNIITYTYDIRLFDKIQICILNDNRIEDIGFCEYLPELIFLNVENNAITSITSLNKNKKNLRTLKLSNNKIQYKNSTLQTIKNLPSLEELTIENNPFLQEIFAYRHLFISSYPNILELNNTKITDLDRDVSRRFMAEHSIKARPSSARQSENKNLKQEDMINSDNNVNPNKTMTQFRVGTTVITKTAYVPNDQEKKTEKIAQKKKKLLPQIDMKSKENLELQRENKELKKIIEEQKKEIDNLKIQVLDLTEVNKQYEEMINQQKAKAEAMKSNKDIDEEKAKLKSQLEMWKKEYCDLLDKTMSTNNNSTNFSNEVLRSHSNFRTRPQTATTPYRSGDFEKVIKEISIMNRKNSLDDSIEDEEEEEINTDVKKEDIKEKEEEEPEENIEEGSDDSLGDIEELCRKSFADLKSMREEMKDLNQKIDEKTTVKGMISERNNEKKENSLLTGKPVIIKQRSSSKNKLKPLTKKEPIKMMKNTLK